MFTLLSVLAKYRGTLQVTLIIGPRLVEPHLLEHGQSLTGQIMHSFIKAFIQKWHMIFPLMANASPMATFIFKEEGSVILPCALKEENQKNWGTLLMTTRLLFSQKWGVGVDFRF